MLTALGDEADRIVGLELGADDYLPKTFSSRELLARLRAVTRRSRVRARTTTRPKELVAGALRLCEETHTAVLDDAPLDLTTLEFAILASLLKSKGRVKSRERLIEEVSERRFDVFDRSIDVHVSSLRKKLGDDAKNPRFIRTIRGIGYSLQEPENPDARMKRLPRFPLLAKVLCWLVLHLVILGWRSSCLSAGSWAWVWIRCSAARRARGWRRSVIAVVGARDGSAAPPLE